MELRAGYKKSDMGIIPKEWSVTNIKGVCQIKTGGKDTQDKVDNGKYPFYVRSNKVERINTWSHDGEAVLTAGDGVGTGKVFHYAKGRFDVHQRVYKMFNFSPKSLDGYFFYLYFSNNFYNRVSQMTAKSSVDSVRMEMIADMKIALPLLEEQRKISKALKNIYNLISSLENLIKKKKNIKQGLMQELLTGKRRLPEFAKNWDGKYKKSDVGEIPSDWKVVRLKDCVVGGLNYGINAAAVKYNPNLKEYLRITDISEDGRYKPSPKVSVDAMEASNYILNSGDIVFARTGASVGKTYLYNKNDGELVFAGFLIKASVNEASYSAKIIQLFTQTQKYWNWIAMNSMRSGQPGVNGNELSSLQLALPSDKREQDEITKIVSTCEDEIFALEEKLKKYKKVKDGMMQTLLTGEIRLE
jgi:type I restriction enzyme, S subunit